MNKNLSCMPQKKKHFKRSLLLSRQSFFWYDIVYTICNLWLVLKLRISPFGKFTKFSSREISSRENILLYSNLWNVHSNNKDLQRCVFAAGTRFKMSMIFTKGTAFQTGKTNGSGKHILHFIKCNLIMEIKRTTKEWNVCKLFQKMEVWVWCIAVILVIFGLSEVEAQSGM